MAAEVVYRKAQMIEADANKACNLGFCLIKQGRYREARCVIEEVVEGRVAGSDDYRTKQRAEELVMEAIREEDNSELVALEDEFVKWAPFRSRRLPIFEEISSLRNQLVC